MKQLVKLEALSVYFDTDTGSLDKGPEDRAGTINALKQMVSQPKFGKC
jgi:vacuolar protein sorting-associated protein 13A/C